MFLMLLVVRTHVCMNVPFLAHTGNSKDTIKTDFQTIINFCLKDEILI